MPTVLRIDGCRFYFFSHEPNEPPHVHVDRAEATIKVWLETLEVARSRGFRAHEIGSIVAMVQEHREMLLELGMNISARVADERVLDVRFDAASLIVDLMDGRTISAPLAWYPRLLRASSEARARWERSAAGFGIHWPGVDEDLSTDGLLRGAPAARSA